MKKLLSLPPNLVNKFHQLKETDTQEWFCTSDPADNKLGSGGGTAWLLEACHLQQAPSVSLDCWLAQEKRILLHAGGQSRRLPAYAASGKILTPIPVFCWKRGQRLGQDLLSLQTPLYEKIMQHAPDHFHTLIASGDVYVRAEKPLQEIPETDIVCYGIWVSPALATRHGVFASNRKSPEKLDFMLQKPTLEELEKWSKTHLFLMDIGIWLLSDKAIRALMKRSTQRNGKIGYYDLYSEYGRALGEHPCIEDEEINSLSVAILPLPGGEFYHFGTSKELITSTQAIQEKAKDLEAVTYQQVKSSPAIFVQNAHLSCPFGETNNHLWIENSYIPDGWQLGSQQIITGVPENNWHIALPDNVCIDIVPIGEKEYALRPYGIDDAFAGSPDQKGTTYLGIPFITWMQDRGIALADLETTDDLQTTPIFPTTESTDELETLIHFMVLDPSSTEGKRLWLNNKRLSANDLADKANLQRLFRQRQKFREENWQKLSLNYERSIFYQLDLVDAAQEMTQARLPIPNLLPEEAPRMPRIHNSMLRAYMARLQGQTGSNPDKDEAYAFQLLREGILEELGSEKQHPHLNVYADQIVWGRSPARIDVAGGWTDTPPYSLYEGGNVVNLAIELNGQPPLQVYIKPCKEAHIVLRSIDMGAVEVVRTYHELADYSKIGSPFSIPKAALCLAGFSPYFSGKKYPSLETQLREFGAGMEVTLLAAIPAGSGLGTSSILSSTVLGAVNDFCGLVWDKNQICQYTLVLEQMLTTGGGWQDQYGGVFSGVKLLQSERGFCQSPLVRWLPEQLFTLPEYRECHLLYYTGITRTAKDILAEIVRSIFLNSEHHLELLSEMKHHAQDMSEALLRGNYQEYGRLVGKTWQQKQALDAGTNPPAVADIIRKIADYTLGHELPGAGGGGYLYMVAKDPQAATRIRRILTEDAPNRRARFVEMRLSGSGLQVSRS